MAYLQSGPILICKLLGSHTCKLKSVTIAPQVSFYFLCSMSFTATGELHIICNAHVCAAQTLLLKILFKKGQKNSVQPVHQERILLAPDTVLAESGTVLKGSEVGVSGGGSVAAAGR